ncbi:hypothetical protein BG006_000734 [Podila minutissima]|uniref:Uncharacterized protein n=1 Tax=Podila minutissima TaxID=64525 RepID=A0A9P5SBJ7_9FUNG|nr:hypothetical protein BG006_000734 [Podila minutissima]
MKRITLPNSATASSVALVLEQCPNLTSFAMDLWDDCSFEVVATTLGGMLEQGRLPHLDSLGLTSHVRDDDLASCIQAMSSVLDLELSSTFFYPLAFAALEPKFATLRTLQVQKCQCVSGEMIQTILESCPALEELVSTSISARLIMEGRPWACLGLKKLVLDFYVDSGTGLQAQSSAVFGQLGRLTRLKTLMIGDSLSFLHSSFQGLDFRLQSGLGQLAGLKRLATLDFGQTRQELGVDDVAWMKRHLKELTAVLGANAPHIRQLTCKEVSSIGQFLIPCTKLTDLTIWLDYQGELTATDPVEDWDRFSMLIRQNPRLSKVAISMSGKSATDNFWAAVSSIARVEISNMQMSEQDIRTFWTGCKTIQELSIDNVGPIDDIDNTCFFTGAQESFVYSDLRRIAVLDRMFDSPACWNKATYHD